MAGTIPSAVSCGGPVTPGLAEEGQLRSNLPPSAISRCAWAARGDRVAALVTDDANRRPVLVLREPGPHPIPTGRSSIGLPLLDVEADSPGELVAIEQRPAGPQGLLGRGRTETWQATVRVDPDRIEVCGEPDRYCRTRPRSDQP